MSCISLLESGKQGNRSWCEGLAQAQGNGKMTGDRFRSSLSGSSNKFSHLSFALKSNTSSVLEWKVIYHKHQIKTINTRLSGVLCNVGPCPWGNPSGAALVPTCRKADSVTPQSSTPAWVAPPGGTTSLLCGHTATGSCYTGLAQLQGLGYRPVPLQVPPQQLQQY